MISKDFRESIREKFFWGELAEVSNLILIGYILRILITENCLHLLQFYFNCFSFHWFKVKNKELSQIYLITKYMILYMYLNEIYFCLNYDLIYMIFR